MNKPSSILSRPKDLAKDKILSSVKSLYFPEIWYIVENFFSLAKRKKILIVGYGLGQEAEALAKLGWDVTLTDPSLKALSELRERFEKASLNAAFEHAEPDSLPFPGHSFGYVLSVNMLEFALKPPEAMREIARVLQPGGKAIVATFNKLSPWGVPAIARVLRQDDLKRSTRFITREELTRLVKHNRLNLDSLLDRAAYLPGMTRMGKLKLPIAGAFVALMTKPEAAQGQG